MVAGAEGGEVGSDGLDEVAVDLAGGDGERALHHVVGVRVLEELGEVGRDHEFFDDLFPGLVQAAAAELEALFDNVGGELLDGEVGVVALEVLHDHGGRFGLAELQDVLDHIVAKGVLGEREGVDRDVGDDALALGCRGVVDATLQDAAPVAVRGDIQAVFAGGVVDELRLGGVEALETPLDHVVAVQIADELDHAGRQGFDDELDLLARGEGLDELLDGARAVGVEGGRDEAGVFGRGLEHLEALLLAASIQHFLDEVVAKRIHHEPQDVVDDFGEDDFDGGRAALIEFPLEEPAAGLIAGGLCDFSLQFSQLFVRFRQVSGGGRGEERAGGTVVIRHARSAQGTRVLPTQIVQAAAGRVPAPVAVLMAHAR